MKKTTRISYFILCMMLIAAMALSTAGCSERPTGNTDEKSFVFTVVDADGKEETFNLTSCLSTVGEALLAENLIEGDSGDYGLYVKKVNGIEADYDKDGTYWAFYIDGEYAMTGVDRTEIKDGSTYTFKIEK